MATLTIRNLDDELKSRLRIRAARHDHSMEEEARSILRTALSDSESIRKIVVPAILYIKPHKTPGTVLI